LLLCYFSTFCADDGKQKVNNEKGCDGLSRAFGEFRGLTRRRCNGVTGYRPNVPSSSGLHPVRPCGGSVGRAQAIHVCQKLIAQRRRSDWVEHRFYGNRVGLCISRNRRRSRSPPAIHSGDPVRGDRPLRSRIRYCRSGEIRCIEVVFPGNPDQGEQRERCRNCTDRFTGAIRPFSSVLALSCSRNAPRVERNIPANSAQELDGYAHIDDPHRFDPWPRALYAKQARGLGDLDTTPELLLCGEQKMLIERIGWNANLEPFAAPGNDRKHR
jgi:hypothetical protein